MDLLVDDLVTRLGHARPWIQKDIVLCFLLQDLLDIQETVLMMDWSLVERCVAISSFFIRSSKITKKSY